MSPEPSQVSEPASRHAEMLKATEVQGRFGQFHMAVQD